MQWVYDPHRGVSRFQNAPKNALCNGFLPMLNSIIMENMYELRCGSDNSFVILMPLPSLSG